MAATSVLPDLEVRPLTRALGAEIRGVDLKRTLSDEEIRHLQGMLDSYLVLFFPGQYLLDDQHRSFVGRFGRIETHPEQKFLEDAEGTTVLVTPQRVSDTYHMDYSSDTGRQLPSGLSSLNMIEGPLVGGDTMFVNHYLVYEALSAPMRDLLDGLTAVHKNPNPPPSGRFEYEPEYLPAVATHPRTGRRYLLFSAHHVQRFMELSVAESRILLTYLRELATRPDLCCRYQWGENPGTLCLADNMATQHYAVNDVVGARMLHRVTVAAETPSEPPNPRWRAHEEFSVHLWGAAAVGGAGVY